MRPERHVPRATIAHGLQQLLQRRGFLDPDGYPRPLREFAATCRYCGYSKC